MRPLLFIVPFLILLSCDSDKTIDEDMQPKITMQERTESLELLEKNCYSCHAPDNSGARLAPTMSKVKNHYLSEGVTEVQFIESIVAYAANPLLENSRMPGAIEKFGVMPKGSFKENELRKIAKFLFYAVITDPIVAEQSLRMSDTINYLETGKMAAMQLKTVLGKNLFAAIEKNGAAGAVDFCNTRAIALTDSVSLAINTKVKRVSNKPRNEDNKANSEEEDVMNKMMTLLSEGETPSPQMVTKEDKIIGYYPIITNGMCLQCHGKPNDDINSITLDKLELLYPQDKAIGYSENELRGLFVVEMDNK